MKREKARVLDSAAVGRAIARVGYEILERNHGIEGVCLVGIKTRGVHIAKRLAEHIKRVEGREVPMGALDVSPYRDDLKSGEAPQDTSELDFSVEGLRVVLVDDVLYTGRTARAAIDAILGRGRPLCIQFAVLVDRGHRELPIRPDFIGKNLPTSSSETVWVRLRECDGEDYAAIME